MIPHAAPTCANSRGCSTPDEIYQQQQVPPSEEQSALSAAAAAAIGVLLYSRQVHC
jgi:hypothetical protein